MRRAWIFGPINSILLSHCIFILPIYIQAHKWHEIETKLKSLTGNENKCANNANFKFDCFSVPFEFNGVPYAWWNDRDGVRRYNWAGSNQSVHTCQCRIDRNCDFSDVNCYCDALVAAQLFDEGTSQKIYVQFHFNQFLLIRLHHQ